MSTAMHDVFPSFLVREKNSNQIKVFTRIDAQKIAIAASGCGLAVGAQNLLNPCAWKRTPGKRKARGWRYGTATVAAL